MSAVWARSVFFTGLDLSDSTRRGLSYLPSIAGLLTVAFDLWLWKVPGVSRITSRPPSVGYMEDRTPTQCSGVDPQGWESGDRSPGHGHRADLLDDRCQFYTRESGSSSISAAIVNKTDSKQAKSLLFTYTNNARQAHSHRSHQHSGTCRLDVTGTTLAASRHLLDRPGCGRRHDSDLVDRRTTVLMPTRSKAAG